MTAAEKLLWSRLRDRRLLGFRFRCQQWVGPYVADFYCWEAKLIVEVDGSQHQDRQGYDRERTRWLKQRGLRVIRFWNNQVTEEMEGVLAALGAVLKERVPSPSRRTLSAGPLPLPERERGR